MTEMEREKGSVVPNDIPDGADVRKDGSYTTGETLKDKGLAAPEDTDETKAQKEKLLQDARDADELRELEAQEASQRAAQEAQDQELEAERASAGIPPREVGTEVNG